MEGKIRRLSQRYETALRANIKQGTRAGFGRAHTLGRQAVAIGLETLDMANMHEKALRAMAVSGTRGTTKRTQRFFAEAILPIEGTHRAAMDATAHLNKMVAMLRRSTASLAAYNRHLKRGIAKRKSVELALKKNGQRYAKLLNEARVSSRHSKHNTQTILTKHEAHRGKLSRELYDEVAQTLLGINVRLIALKRKTMLNILGLRKEIASTQRLVAKSMKIVKWFGREIGTEHGE